MLKFLNYIRYRSLGLLLTVSYLLITTQDIGYFVLLVLFLAHSYSIYVQEDGGVNHLLLIGKINHLEFYQKKNQQELITLLESIRKL